MENGRLLNSPVRIGSSLLALSDSGFLTTAKVIIGANVPIMIIEGFITMFTVTFLARVQPEILHLDQL